MLRNRSCRGGRLRHHVTVSERACSTAADGSSCSTSSKKGLRLTRPPQTPLGDEVAKAKGNHQSSLFPGTEHIERLEEDPRKSGCRQERRHSARQSTDMPLRRGEAHGIFELLPRDLYYGSTTIPSASSCAEFIVVCRLFHQSMLGDPGQWIGGVCRSTCVCQPRTLHCQFVVGDP